MNHTSRPFVLSRVFKSAKVAGTDNDDLAALEKSFRRSAFAFLPSAATPSRTPSNTLIASSQALVFEPPVYFHIPFGKDKWPEIVDWYINYGSKDSTAIDKMQLRKDHQQPYCHEYIVLFTRGGHSYRIDRRPDANAAFDTIMKEGCTPYDTIEEVHSNSLKALNRISDCVVELHWRTEQTIDLLFVLSICFRLHNDKSARRYTLQHYNCYFLSWTIIMIIVRNTAACGVGLNAAIECGVWPKGLQNWNVELELDRARNSERILGLKLEQEREQAQMRKLKLELVRVRVPKRERVRALKRELLDVERARERMQELTEERERELKRARALEREREQEWTRVRVLAQAVAQVPMVLGWQLAQGWKRREENVRERLRELLRAVDTGFLPGELDTMVKTVPNRSAWLRKSVCIVLTQMMEDPTGDVYNALSDLAEFPTLISVSLNHKYTDSIKSNAPDPGLHETTPKKLEQHMVEVVENHAARVARWGLGSRAEVKSDILDGMWRTWQNVSPLSLHIP